MNKNKPILTAMVGNNSDIFPSILEIYAQHNDIIIDITYGKGVFWKNIDTNLYRFCPSDIMTGIDYNILPYKNNIVNMVIFDPPYMGHNGGKNYPVARNYQVDVPKYDKRYIEKIYFGGINEAYRVLQKKGILVVKCQDEIQSGKQKLNHIELIQYCISNGFIIEDIFILVQKNSPIMRHNYQLHARKNHSYFLVFTKK